MESTWRARPMPAMGRLTLALVIALLLAALLGSALIVGGRLLSGPLPFETRQATAAIPQGDDALFAFTSWGGDASLRGDLYVVRADGKDGRRLTADTFDDWSPAWSPDGGRIAFYSGDDDSVQLRVIGPEGVATTLVDSPGCWNPTSEPPAWSPDGRFIAYIADRDATDGVCDMLFADVFVVRADGKEAPHRLLADDQTIYTSDPDWDGDRIALRGGTTTEGGLWVAEVTDPSAPWGLTASRIDGMTGVDPVAFGWPRWSPDGTALASTAAITGQLGSAVVMAPDGSDPLTLWADATKDAILPDWSPDGSLLSLLVSRQILSDHAVYRLALVPADGSEPTVFKGFQDLSGNAGPARFSPDGTRLLVRVPAGPTPGDIIVYDLDGGIVSVTQAQQWSSMDWQPVVNADNPAKAAPAGRPQL